MFVGPCGVDTRGVNYSENCVRPHEDPGVKRCATARRVPYESAGIDRSDSTVAGRCAAVELRLVNINAFVILGGRAGEYAGCAGAAGESIAGRHLRGSEATVVCNVVERAHRARRTARHERHQTGKRVRGFGGGGIEIIDAGLSKFGEI